MAAGAAELQPGRPSDILRRRAQTEGSRPFLTFREQTYSWLELDQMTDRLAAGLLRLGVEPGDAVAIMLRNRVEYIVLWFALDRVGAVEVPINPEHRGYLLEHILNQAGCRIVVAEAVALEALEAAREQTRLECCLLVAESGPAPAYRVARQALYQDVIRGDGAPAARDRDDLACILFTSGTTGPSKGVMISTGFALNMAATVAVAAGYGPSDRLYNALPLFHGNAKLLSLLPALISGAEVVLAEKFSASGFWADVTRHGCTEFNYIGGILSILLLAPPSAQDRRHSLRVMVGAGASAQVQGAFEERFGVRLIEAYGMTEIGVPLISLPDARRAGSCGRPTADYEVRIADPSGEEAGCDEVGELWVRPRRVDCMFRGYVGMAEATVAAWRDLWFHTGDNMRRDADGFYFFMDRAKDSIRRLGENISSFEVEKIAMSHDSILEAAAIPVASELGEDEVMLCVVAKDPAAFDVAELHDHCVQRMAPYMRPRFYRVLDRLPKTPTERVQKYILREEGRAPGTLDLGPARSAR